MKLYLVQHGEAVSEAEDPERPLSGRGRKEVAQMAEFLAGSGVRVARIVNSGKTRARQTAEGLAALLAGGGAISEVTRGLAPKDKTDWLAHVLQTWSEDTMVVGHLPHLSKMVARLLTRSEDLDLVAFTPGTIVCLERRETGAWSVAWMVSPALVSGGSPPAR